MADTRLHLLIVEDNDDHFTLVQRHLERASRVEVRTTRTTRLDETLALAGNQNEYDAILLDLGLPDSGVVRTLPAVIETFPSLPVIVLTSLNDLDFATGAVHQGAEDYLVKSELDGEVMIRSVRYAIERKRSRQALRTYAAELERRNRELDEFTRVVSHDLKSPLAVIQMELSMLRNGVGELAEENRRRLESTLEETRSMARLIDDLLRYARFGHIEAQRERVDLAKALDDARCGLATLVEERGAVIEVCGDLPAVAGVRSGIIQVFQNLIANAIRVAPSDGPARVNVSCGRHGPMWRISVSDDGPGIPAEDLDRVFDLFCRGTGVAYPGTGLGLSICKRVVEAHGGTIGVESEPGCGATFHFTLPAAADDDGSGDHRGA